MYKWYCATLQMRQELGQGTQFQIETGEKKIIDLDLVEFKDLRFKKRDIVVPRHQVYQI